MSVVISLMNPVKVDLISLPDWTSENSSLENWKYSDGASYDDYTQFNLCGVYGWNDKKSKRSNRLKNHFKDFMNLKKYIIDLNEKAPQVYSTCPAERYFIPCERILYGQYHSDTIKHCFFKKPNTIFWAFNKERAYDLLRRFVKKPEVIREFMEKYEEGMILEIAW